MYAAFESGRCDVQAAPRSLLEIRRWSSPDPAAYHVWETPITLTALTPVYRWDDEQWADIVNWTLWGLIQADLSGITSANLNTFMRAAAETDEAYSARVGLPAARLLDPALGAGAALGLPNDFMAGVISRVGNYSEIYDRSLGPDSDVPLPRGINSLVRDGGLLDSPSWR
jgi:general L-amino acid transport system substrate-binding protein